MNAPAAAPDVAAEIGRWLAYLGAERRMSAKTLEAYRRDVPSAQVHIVDGGHFALDTAADHIASLVTAFLASAG